MCRIPAVIIAVVAGAGLTACAGTGSNSPTAAASGSQAAASSTAPASSPASGGSAGAAPSGTPAAAARNIAPQAPAPVPTTAGAANSATYGNSGTQSFTVHAIPSDNVVSAWGSYTKMGERVKVTVCVKQTGSAYSVGVLALAYNTSGLSQKIGAVILTGPGITSCGTRTFIFYTAHLKVHSFIGDHGYIVKTGPVLTLY
jgi:hypothetical protein